MNIFIIITIILLLILLFYNYNSYLNNKYYNEGIEIINKLNNVKKRDETFNSIKKYYINLERSKDRLESIEKEFRDYEIGNYERIEACDGKYLSSIKKGKFKELEFENIKDKKVTKSELATTCSHLKAIKKSYDDGEEMAIIMEDDMNFTLMPHWKKSLGEILENIPTDLELLQLTHGKYGYLFLNILKPDFKKYYKEQKIKLRNRKETFCMGSYLITRLGMKKIIDKFFVKNKIILNNDKDIRIDIGILDLIKTYYLTEPLFLLDNFKSKTTVKNIDRHSYYESLEILKSYM